MIGTTSSGTLIVLLGMYALDVHLLLPRPPLSLGTFFAGDFLLKDADGAWIAPHNLVDGEERQGLSLGLGY